MTEFEKQVIELRKNGLSYKKIMAITNGSDWEVRKICHNNGIPKGRIPAEPKPTKKKKELTLWQLEIKGYREQGLCCSEIVTITGKNGKKITQTANAIKMPFTDAEKRKSIELAHKKLINKDISKTISDRCPNLELEKKRAESEKQKQINRKIKEEEQNEKRKLKFWKKDFNQITLKQCSQCGSIFYGKNKYCSKECANKANNNRKDKRFGNRKINHLISAKSLYKRDGGICWICGNQCDLNDFKKIKDKNGNDCIVCGNNYPSVDHLIPVCEGGTDTWDNVKLACRYCNSKRYWEGMHA